MDNQRETGQSLKASPRRLPLIRCFRQSLSDVSFGFNWLWIYCYSVVFSFKADVISASNVKFETAFMEYPGHGGDSVRGDGSWVPKSPPPSAGSGPAFSERRKVERRVGPSLRRDDTGTIVGSQFVHRFELPHQTVKVKFPLVLNISTLWV